jgi:FKBP-type peptidyl-prolyl cis-trans isomerase (trigger factor)
VEQLYGGMRQLCELAKEQNAITDMKTQLQEQVIENTTFDITEEEISVYVGQQVEEISAYASYYGYDLETYVTSAGITMEQFEADCRESAILRIQTALLQEWIAKEEGITVSEEEYAKKAEEYMTYYGYSTLEEFEAAYTREAIEKQVLADLTMAVIVENAVEEK